MKLNFSSIQNFLLGNEPTQVLEEKMLIAANLIGLVVSIIGGFMNFYLGSSLVALITPLILTIILIILFYFIRFKKRFSNLVFPIILFSFLGLCIVWIFNAGYNGSNNLVFLTILVLALSITPVSNFRFLYFFYIFLIISLHFFHFYFPASIQEFPNEKTRFIDTIITVIYTSSFIYLMITYLIRNYRQERQISSDRGKKLEELNKELKISNASKDKLFSIIAHDLKSPFNTILGFSELSLEKLRDGDYSKSEKDILQSISSAKRTLVLLENLLQWAKTQSGQIDFLPEKLNLQSVASEVIGDLNPSAELKNISLIYFQPYEISCLADKNMLLTILRNLISNSIKFTNPGGKVRIYGKSNPENVEITVTDNGMGMKDEIMNSIFRIEANKSSLGTSSEQGSGLGLILVKEFVEKHGGTISAESIPGQGSKFVFTLPG